MTPMDKAWVVLKNFVLKPKKKSAGFYDHSDKSANVNLAHPSMSRFAQFVEGPHGYDEGVQEFAEHVVGPVLEHEMTHKLIYDDLNNAVNQGVLPRDRFRTAHEISAIAMSQQAADPFQATRDASSETRNHPRVVRDWPRDSKMTPFVGVDEKGSFQPKPIISEDLPYTYPERYQTE